MQALFRPVSMTVPDLAMICEVTLMSEGFQDSRVLSRKCLVLYELCEHLLSKVRMHASAEYSLPVLTCFC